MALCDSCEQWWALFLPNGCGGTDRRHFFNWQWFVTFCLCREPTHKLSDISVACGNVWQVVCGDVTIATVAYSSLTVFLLILSLLVILNCNACLVNFKWFICYLFWHIRQAKRLIFVLFSVHFGSEISCPKVFRPANCGKRAILLRSRSRAQFNENSGPTPQYLGRRYYETTKDRRSPDAKTADGTEAPPHSFLPGHSAVDSAVPD